MGNLCRIGVVFATVVIVGTLAPTPGRAAMLDPTAFTPIGPNGGVATAVELNQAGTYYINSSSSLANPTLVYGSQTYTGVFRNGVAVFDFKSLDIGSGVLIQADQGTGTLPIALLSQTTESIEGTVSVSALANSQGAGAGNTGVGGYGSFAQYPAYGASGGGGGGFGGAGGTGASVSSLAGGTGGIALANLGATLQGGSSGSGFGGQGGGGGAIELGAVQSLTISGLINAIGGDSSYIGGGGGSGGGIFLHANSVTLTGTFDVQGGAGGVGAPDGQSPLGAGGGGGGGEILVDSGSFVNSFGATFIMTGGAAGADSTDPASAGSSGFRAFGTIVPEPSSLILVGTSTVGLLGLTGFRRLRQNTRLMSGCISR